MSQSRKNDVQQDDQQTAVRSAQERTLGLYHQLMQINAASHLIRTLRELSLLEALRERQCTLNQLCSPRSLDPRLVSEILDAAVSIGIVEQYDEDFALSRAAHLLCQYDEDLADSSWQRLTDLASQKVSREVHDDQLHLNHLAATQWVHTSSAMEAAEVLDFGGDSSGEPLEILDLGCGSAVWTCAMAYRDPTARITAVDHESAIEAASKTAESIGLSDRFRTIVADPSDVELETEHYDWVVVAQRISGLGKDEANRLLGNATKSLKVGGRLVVIDWVEMDGKPTLADRMASLRLLLETRCGAVRSPEELQEELKAVGLEECQFALLSKGKAKIGLVVGTKLAS
ncbi:MAG: class I SAM-dependent methyltransferase [Planctomycetota bacterium]|nr:class I SAM-dependent methyltransferase [Planctomycetota bacterium]